jgi:hypothetical protein
MTMTATAVEATAVEATAVEATAVGATGITATMRMMEQVVMKIRTRIRAYRSRESN